MPFANSAEYAKHHGSFNPVDDTSDIAVVWDIRDDKCCKVTILLRGEPFGMLIEGSKPGWSAMAQKDGPLAKVFQKENVNK